MSGKDTLGFLTESALLPRKSKPITSVPHASVAPLASLIERYQAELAAKQNTGGTKTARPRKANAFDSIGSANKGVEARSSHDAVAQLAEAPLSSQLLSSPAMTAAFTATQLAQKTIVYDILSGNLKGSEAINALKAVELNKLSATFLAKIEETLYLPSGYLDKLGSDGDKASRSLSSRARMANSAPIEDEIMVDMTAKRRDILSSPVPSMQPSHSSSLPSSDAELIALAKRRFQSADAATVHTGVRAKWEMVMSEHEKELTAAMAEDTNRIRGARQAATLQAEAQALLRAAVTGEEIMTSEAPREATLEDYFVPDNRNEGDVIQGSIADGHMEGEGRGEERGEERASFNKKIAEQNVARVFAGHAHEVAAEYLRVPPWLQLHAVLPGGEESGEERRGEETNVSSFSSFPSTTRPQSHAQQQQHYSNTYTHGNDEGMGAAQPFDRDSDSFHAVAPPIDTREGHIHARSRGKGRRYNNNDHDDDDTRGGHEHSSQYKGETESFQQPSPGPFPPFIPGYGAPPFAPSYIPPYVPPHTGVSMQPPPYMPPGFVPPFPLPHT